MLTTKVFTFFTEISEKYLVDKSGSPVGRIFDLIVRPTEPYPRVISLVISRGIFRKSYAVIPWEGIKMISKDFPSPEDEFHLLLEPSELSFKDFYYAETDMALRKDILDKQIVDTFNRKVVRVNDIHLLKAENNLHIAHVDIGMRGLIRRLGAEEAIDSLVKLFKPDSKYLTTENFISWKYVQPLAIHPVKGTISLNVSQQQLSTIPPADLGDIMLDLDVYERSALFKSLDTPLRVKALSELDLEIQKSLVQELDTKNAVEMLNHMPPDKVVDLLGVLPDKKVDEFLFLMESDRAKKLSALLGHEIDSAGGLMTTEFIALPDNITVADAINRIREMTGRVETIHYAYIIDEENHLIGMTTFRHLLLADPQKQISEIMVKRPISVHLTDTARKVSYLFDRYNLFAIPVVTHDNVIQGIITVDDILSHVIQLAWKKRTRKPKL